MCTSQGCSIATIQKVGHGLCGRLTATAIGPERMGGPAQRHSLSHVPAHGEHIQGLGV